MLFLNNEYPVAGTAQWIGVRPSRSEEQVVTLVAILIGLIFGVYPEIKAARLYPIQAIRNE